MNYKKIIIIVMTGVLILIGIYYLFNNENITNYPSRGTDIIAFGDSLVEGMGSSGGNDFVSLLSKKIDQPIINLGHSGDTTEDGVKRIGELDKYNPKIVILLLGGNDSLKKISISDTHKNLEIIIKNIQSRGAIVLLLGVRGGIFNDVFDKEFKNLSSNYHTAFASDILGGLFGDVRYMSDIIHPNNLGYEIIANRIYPVINKILK